MIYNIQEIDRLEAQRVSGKIIPALATTTSLVAGLTCLELLKIASERIRSRKQILHNTKKNKDLTPFGIFEKYLENLKQTFHPNSNKNNLFKESVKVNLREIERDRVLGRFRNSFVNIARPLLTFSQPIAAEYYTVGDQSFNMWDTIEV
jgi:predicted ATPase